MAIMHKQQHQPQVQTSQYGHEQHSQQSYQRPYASSSSSSNISSPPATPRSLGGNRNEQASYNWPPQEHYK